MAFHYADLIEALAIFDKYAALHKPGFHAEHDEIYAGPSQDLVSVEDIHRLAHLGWTPSAEGFHFFTD